jgi:hypothetical protein
LKLSGAIQIVSVLPKILWVANETGRSWNQQHECRKVRMVRRKDFLMPIATKNLEVRHSILDKLTIFDHVTLLRVVPFSIVNGLAFVDFWKVVIPNAYAKGNGFEFCLRDGISGFVVIELQGWLVPKCWPLKYIIPHWGKVGIMNGFGEP